MFKISCNVGDDNLATVIKKTAGLVSDLAVHFVDNNPVRPLGAKPSRKGNRKGLPGNNQTGKNQFVDRPAVNYTEALGLVSGNQFRAGDVASKLHDVAGVAPSSVYYILGKEIAAGRVRKIEAGLYEAV